MNLNRFSATAVLCAWLLGWGAAVNAASGPAVTVSATQAFLTTLDPPMRTKAMLIFGGHHLALNITLAGNQGTLAPNHTAAQPARFTLDRKDIRASGDETDLAFSAHQPVGEVATKTSGAGDKIPQFRAATRTGNQTAGAGGREGVVFGEKQRALLLKLIRQWTGILPDYAADSKMEEIKAGLAETWFAWSGPTAPGAAAYFRIQGPAIWIELAPQNLIGVATQHIHTIHGKPIN